MLHNAAAMLTRACHSACYTSYSGIASDKLSGLLVDAGTDLPVQTYQPHLTLTDLCCQEQWEAEHSCPNIHMCGYAEHDWGRQVRQEHLS